MILALDCINNSLFLVSENEDIVQKRQTAVNNINRLKAALTAINALKRKQGMASLSESDPDSEESDSEIELSDEEKIEIKKPALK